MTHEQIVMKLIGKVTPAGKSEVDAERFDNLKELCELVNGLVTIIDIVAQYYDSHEASVKKAGEYAKDFLTNTLGITE